MKWNLRLAAANRGIWKASELQRMLAEAGLTISAGKMSGLWSGRPASIKLGDLDVICAVVGCGVEELLIPEPGKFAPNGKAAASPQAKAAVTPRRRDGPPPPPDCLSWGACYGSQSTAGPLTPPPAPRAARRPPAVGSSRSRRATAGCAGCRPASPPQDGAGSRRRTSVRPATGSCRWRA